MYEPSAILAKNVRPGMALQGSCYYNVVKSVEPSKTGRTVTITYYDHATHNLTTKRYGSDTPLFIDDKIINYIICDRFNGKYSAYSCTDDCARNAYEYYMQYLGTEYARITWERSTNGGNTWDIIKRQTSEEEAA